MRRAVERAGQHVATLDNNAGGEVVKHVGHAIDRLGDGDRAVGRQRAVVGCDDSLTHLETPNVAELVDRNHAGTVGCEGEAVVAVAGGIVADDDVRLQDDGAVLGH